MNVIWDFAGSFGGHENAVNGPPPMDMPTMNGGFDRNMKIIDLFSGNKVSIFLIFERISYGVRILYSN